MSESDERLPLLRVCRNFLSSDEVSYWSSLVRNQNFWKTADAHRHSEDGHVGYQPPHYIMNEDFIKNVSNFYESEESLVEKICRSVEDFFGEDFLVGSTVYFRKWIKGYSQHAHLDQGFNSGVLDFRSHGDERESQLPRAFHDVATVLYYNGDFDGGEITFLEKDISIKPEPGMLVMFPCTDPYLHGVNEILSGERYMSAHFWTRAKTMAMHLGATPIGDSWRYKIRWPEKVERQLSDDGHQHSGEV